MRIIPGVLLVVLAAVTYSDGKVTVPFKSMQILPGFTTKIVCKVEEGETFVGWFNMTDNTLVPDKFMKKDPAKNTYTLVLPAGTSTYAGGKYQCRGNTNKDDAEILSFCLSELSTVPENQILQVAKTEKIVVGCHSYPKSTFTWKKNGTAFDPTTGRFRMDQLGTITVTNVEKSDQGTYSLQIGWNGRNQNKDFYIAVGQKPQFTHKVPLPSEVIGVVGYNFTFCCKATGDETPKVTWTKKTTVAEVPIDVTNPSKFILKDGCLIIKDLQGSDVASYRCVAKNKLGEIEAVVKVTKISEPATITSSFTDTVKNVGDDFEVSCVASGAPTLSVEWRRNGLPYLNQKKTTGKSLIKFKGLKLQDAATFTCTAGNGLRFNDQLIVSRRSFRLSITSKPIVNKPASETPVYSFIGYSTPVIIRCQFYGYPVPAVVMTKDGKEVAKGNSSAELSIITKKKDDFGNFLCTATNSIGSGTHTVELKLAEKPSKPQGVAANKTCKDIVLNWAAPASNGGMFIEHYIITVEKDKKVVAQATVDGQLRSYKIDYKFVREMTYKVSIQARSKAGASAKESSDVTMAKYCVPSAPKITNRNLVAEGAEFKVTWSAPDFNGYDKALKYQVQWTRTSDPPSKTMKSAELETMEFTIEGLKNGKHKLQVFAINRAGRGSPDTRSFTVKDSEGKPTTGGPPQVGKRTGGMSKGAIAGIVIAVLLIVLITIDLFCCFFNSCGLIFCCQKAFCGGAGGGSGGKYEQDGKKDDAEMEKLKNEPENV